MFKKRIIGITNHCNRVGRSYRATADGDQGGHRAGAREQDPAGRRRWMGIGNPRPGEGAESAQRQRRGLVPSSRLQDDGCLCGCA